LRRRRAMGWPFSSDRFLRMLMIERPDGSVTFDHVVGH
jgi:hypothetical protein